MLGLAGFNIQHEHAVVGVRECQFGAIRRPGRHEIEGRIGNLDSLLIGTELIRNNQSIFIIGIIKPGDLLTVCISENDCGAVIHEILAIERVKPKAASADDELRENKVRGVVKFLNTFKGYGFVDIGADKRDVFVHLRTLRNCGIHNLTEGQEILLHVSDEGKGPQATEVRLFSQAQE